MVVPNSRIKLATVSLAFRSTVPPPVIVRATPVPVRVPLRTSVPPPACEIVDVDPDVGARIIGAEIVFVPEVFCAPIATAVVSLTSDPIVNPVAVSVNAMPLEELVKL